MNIADLYVFLNSYGLLTSVDKEEPPFGVTDDDIELEMLLEELDDLNDSPNLPLSDDELINEELCIDLETSIAVVTPCSSP